MVQNKLIKLASKYEQEIEKLGVKQSSYNFLLKNITKNFLNELSAISKESVVNYIREYNFSSIFNEDGAPIKTEVAEKNLQALGYFLFFAAERYGAEFVFKNLLPASTVHKTHSKFNPINWLKWIFNRVVWSEIFINPKLEQDEAFTASVEKFKALSATSYKVLESVDLSKNEDSLQALNYIIKRAAGEGERLNELKASAEVSIPAIPATLPAQTQPAAAVQPTPPLPPVSNTTPVQQTAAAAPPPPPPPSGSSDGVTQPASAPPATPANKGDRTSLLAAINGTGGAANFQFKNRVGLPEERDPKNKDKKPGEQSGVAIILQRRIALMPSDTESERSNNSHSNDSEWDDGETSTKKPKKRVKRRHKKEQPKSTVSVPLAAANDSANTPLNPVQAEPLPMSTPKPEVTDERSRSEGVISSKPALPPKPSLAPKPSSNVSNSAESHSGTDSGNQSGSDDKSAIPSTVSDMKAKLLAQGFFSKPPISSAVENSPMPSLQAGA